MSIRTHIAVGFVAACAAILGAQAFAADSETVTGVLTKISVTTGSVVSNRFNCFVDRATAGSLAYQTRLSPNSSLLVSVKRGVGNGFCEVVSARLVALTRNDSTRNAKGNSAGQLGTSGVGGSGISGVGGSGISGVGGSGISGVGGSGVSGVGGSGILGVGGSGVSGVGGSGISGVGGSGILGVGGSGISGVGGSGIFGVGGSGISGVGGSGSP